MKGAEAPARVEAALLAAFRTRAASAAEGSSDTAAEREVVPVSGHAPARRWSWAKTIAVASMAAAASLALFMLVSPDTPRSAPIQKAMIVEPPTGSNGGGPPAPAIAKASSSQDFEEGVGPSPTPNEGRTSTPRAAFVPRPRAVNASYNNRGGGFSRTAQAAAAQEVATEFIPLVNAGPYTQAEEGHLVRVELPRSALASFGLSVNAEASGGRVKADVLMGQDGIARAIRFVR
jgi:hypothetical protein